MIPALPVPLISLVYPLLTVAALWAVVVWALKDSNSITTVAGALTDPKRQDNRNASSAGSLEKS